MKRCVIYTRESRLDVQEQIQNSIKIQKLFCERFIQEHQDWILLDNEYDDVGYDADTLDRPALRRLFYDIQHTTIDYLVVYKINRLASSTQIYSEILQTLAKSNVSIVPVIQIDDDFLVSGNPVYTKFESNEDRELLELATKYLHMPDTKTSGSLLEGLVKCSVCGETMVKSSKHYICKNHPMRPINAAKCEAYVVDEVRKLLREPALTGLNHWQLEKLNITHDDALQMTKNLDKMWPILPRSEVKRIIHLIVQSVIVGEDLKISVILRPDLVEKVKTRIDKMKSK